MITLKPCLLVSLHTAIEGGVRYTRTDLEGSVGADGTKIDRWETIKTTIDEKEHVLAVKVRSKCQGLVRGVCAPTVFGLICLGVKKPLLDEAVKEARRLADAFNAEAKTVRVLFFILVARIAETDEEAVRAIGEEVRGLVGEMDRAIQSFDVEAVRKTVLRAKQVGTALSGEAKEKFSAAIETARKAANQIARRVDRGGEDAAKVLTEIQLDALSSARFAFLDLSNASDVSVENVLPAELRVVDPIAAPDGVEVDTSGSPMWSSDDPEEGGDGVSKDGLQEDVVDVNEETR